MVAKIIRDNLDTSDAVASAASAARPAEEPP